MDGLILAAGRGSRLGRLTDLAPKAMQYLPRGSSLLDHHIIRLEALGVVNIFIVIGYLGSDIQRYVKGCYPRCRLILQEGELGTAADGLLASEEYLHDDFVVVHGDHYFSEDPFALLAASHQGGWITFLVESTDKSGSFGYGERCLFRETDRVVVHYPIPTDSESGDRTRDGLREMILVDGCMVLPVGIFQAIRSARQADSRNLDMKDIFKHLSQRNHIEMMGVEVPGWWANINTEDVYLDVLRRLLVPERTHKK